MDSNSTRFPTEKATPVGDDPLRIVQTIQERWPNLTVQYLHPDAMADPGDPPFRIVERCRDGIERQVMQVWQLDQRVIAELEMSDLLVNGESALMRSIKINEKKREDERKRFSEETKEYASIVAAALQSRKQTYTFRRTDDGRLVAINKDTEKYGIDS